MARSLTVIHDEKPATSLIMTAFIGLAICWLAATALLSTGTDAAVLATPTVNVQ